MTCAPPPSSGTWTCAGPSTASWPPTATSAATDLDLPWEKLDRVEELKAALEG